MFIEIEVSGYNHEYWHMRIINISCISSVQIDNNETALIAINNTFLRTRILYEDMKTILTGYKSQPLGSTPRFTAVAEEIDD